MMKWTYCICFEHFEHLPSFTTDILFERLAKHSGHQFSQFKAKQDQRAVTTVAIKKGGGGHKLDKKKAQLEIAKSFGCFEEFCGRGAEGCQGEDGGQKASFKHVKSEKTCFASEIFGAFF